MVQWIDAHDLAVLTHDLVPHRTVRVTHEGHLAAELCLARLGVPANHMDQRPAGLGAVVHLAIEMMPQTWLPRTAEQRHAAIVG